MLNEQARSTYLNILAEIKLRLDTVEKILTGHVPIYRKVADETCLLQFRLVAELVAIGCLVLHEDAALSSAGTLAKEWNAGKIFKRLNSLHADFYPRPLKSEKESGGKAQWLDLGRPFMDKEKLIKIYDQEFGAGLHRGNFRKIFRADPPLDFPKHVQWLGDFKRLLDRHTVVAADGQHVCHFNMCPMGEHPTAYLFARLNETNQPSGPEITV